MLAAVDLVGDNFVDVYVLDAVENVLLNFGGGLFQLGDEIFDLHALRACARWIAGGAGVGKTAGAGYEVQIVVIAPELYLVLADKVQRANKLHTLIILAVQLRHHGAYLTAVYHAHEYSFDNVIVVVTQRYLVAARELSVFVKMSAAHFRAEVAGVLIHVID